MSQKLIFSVKYFGLLLLTIFFMNRSSPAYSQTPLPASLPDKPWFPTQYGFAQLSTAMIESSLFNTTLSAIVEADFKGTHMTLILGDGFYSYPINIQVNANPWSKPDVAIVDDPSGLGEKYKVVVTYRSEISPGSFNYALKANV